MAVSQVDASALQFGGEKIFQHLDRLGQWQNGQLPVPVTVELDLTNLCNHACPSCSFSYLVNIVRDSIEFDLAQLIIKDLSEMGVKAVTFSGGGEPLLYGEDRILELMRQCRSAGMDVGLITNGSKITKPDFIDVCTWMRVSLDGYDESTFERFHGRSPREFDKCVSALRFISGESYRRKQSGLSCATVGVGFLTDGNTIERNDLEKMTAFCSEIIGLDYLQFRPLVTNMVADTSLSGGYTEFTESQLNELRIAYLSARNRHARDDYRVMWSVGKYTALSQEGFGKQYDRCVAHFLEATISADSRVYICCHTQGQADYCLGDLKEDSFANVWNSPRARDVYNSFNPKTSCPPACRLHLQNNLLSQIQSGAIHPNFI